MEFTAILFQDKLAINITTEQGKTLKDAHGDVFRGLGKFLLSILCSLTRFHSMAMVKLNIYMQVSYCYFYYFHLEVVEHACGMATLQMGEYVPNVSNGIDTYSLREPLGVCAGICPFNFPAMIPLWVSPFHSLPLFGCFFSSHSTIVLLYRQTEQILECFCMYLQLSNRRLKVLLLKLIIRMSRKSQLDWLLGFSYDHFVFHKLKALLVFVAFNYSFLEKKNSFYRSLFYYFAPDVSSGCYMW